METLYLVRPYKSKKAIREAIAANGPVLVYSASMFHKGKIVDGEYTLCGPSEYDRKYYAEITVKDTAIVRIK